MMLPYNNIDLFFHFFSTNNVIDRYLICFVFDGPPSIVDNDCQSVQCLSSYDIEITILRFQSCTIPRDRLPRITTRENSLKERRSLLQQHTQIFIIDILIFIVASDSTGDTDDICAPLIYIKSALPLGATNRSQSSFVFCSRRYDLRDKLTVEKGHNQRNFSPFEQCK